MGTFFAKALGFALLFLISLELYAIFLPATTYPPTLHDKQFGFDRLNPNHQRTGTFTFGRLAQIRADWHINDEGWNSRLQYTNVLDDTRLLIAITGDSYINSLYHQDATQISGLLKKHLPSNAEVYGFGMPGTNLADFWRFSCYYKKFKPKICLYLINSDDISSALADIKRNPKDSQVQFCDSGIRFLERQEDPLESIRSRLRISKAWTFLNQNFDFTNEAVAVARKLVRLASPPTKQKQLSSDLDSDSIERNTFCLIEAIIAENPNARHIFLPHPNRDLIYQSGGHNFSPPPELEPLKALLGTAIRAELLDLSPVFAEDYRRHSRRFEFKINKHFDEYGNSIAAKAIADYLGLSNSPTR